MWAQETVKLYEMKPTLGLWADWWIQNKQKQLHEDAVLPDS